MIEALHYEFMRNALLAGILVSVACGVIGVFVVVNRRVFVSGGIAHAAYGGVGLGYLLGFSPVVGALLFSLGAALAMGSVRRATGERGDTLIGVMWAMGMALGVVFVDLAAGYKADLMSYLFGSILTVPRGDLWIMAALDLVILASIGFLYKEFVAMAYDETFVAVRNVPVTALDLLLTCLTALTVVMSMRVVGLILVIALLTIPAAISIRFVRGMHRVMIVAVVLGTLFTCAGLWLSYVWNLTSGASIILVAGAAYIAALLIPRPGGRRPGGLPARSSRGADTR